MKRLLSFALPFILAGALTAWAQSDTTPSPSSTNQATSPSSSSSTQSNSQNSTSTQANPATSSTMAQSGTSTTNQSSLEGCVIKRQTDYFLQPETGEPVKLNSSQDLSQHVGHHVRVEGNVHNGLNSNATGTESNSSTSNSSTSNGSYGSNSTATGKVENGNSSPSGTQYETFDVTRVDMVSESCPTGMQNQSVPNNNSQSPKSK
jgi:hypothetical protein